MTFPTNTPGQFSGTQTGINPSPNAPPLTAVGLNAAIGSKADAIAGQLLNPTIQGGAVAGANISTATAISAAASARTLSDRFSDRLSVLDFQSAQAALIGSGADDLPALQAAVNVAAGRASLLIPAGLTLSINGTLNIPSNTNIILDGVLTQAGQPVTAIPVVKLAANATNVSITGTGVIDGNAAHQPAPFTSGSQAGITTTTNTSMAVRVYISGITIQNCVNWPINLVFIQDSLVENCRFLSSNDSAEFSHATRCSFVGCYADSLTDDGIGLYGACNDCEVVNCYVSKCNSGAFIRSDSAQPTPCNNCRLIGNFARDVSQIGIEVNSNGATGPHTDALVSGNYVTHTTPESSAQVTDFYANGVSGMLLDGNYGTGNNGIAPCYGFILTGTITSVKISNNRFTGGTDAVIIINSPAASVTDLEITSNTIYSATAGTTIGILASDNTLNNTTLSNNVFNGSFSALMQNIQNCRINQVADVTESGGGSWFTSSNFAAPILSVYASFNNLGIPQNSVSIHTGAGIPTITATSGSMFIRNDGAAGARIYISQGGGVWNAIAGV